MVIIDGLDFFKIKMNEQKSLDRKTTLNDVLQFHTLWVKLRLHYFRDNACFQELTGLYFFQGGVVGVLTVHN